MSVTYWAALKAAPFVATQWDVDTPEDSLAPETAWDEAYPMVLPPRLFRSSDIEDIRYHDPTQTILVRKGSLLVELRNLRRPFTRDELELRAIIKSDRKEFHEQDRHDRRERSRRRDDR